MASKSKYIDTSYADTGYAPTKYLGNQSSSVGTPTGPIAVPRLVRGEDGMMHTVYVDPVSNQSITDLKGYTVISGGSSYEVTAEDDEDGDGKVDEGETSSRVARGEELQGHTTHEDASPHTPGPAGTASNNFGYQHKPGLLGPAAQLASVVNPGVGAALGLLGKAYNVNNMDAVNDARKMLNLDPLSAKQMIGQAMKDNQGQVARVGINNQNYSVGFEAMDPNNRTNLTPNEAAKRAAMFGMKEVDDTAPQSTASKLGSRISKALGIEPGIAGKALSKMGMQKGWATKALDKAFGVVSLPDQAPTPTPAPRPENMAAAVPGAANTTPSAQRTTPSVTSTPSGMISHPNNPAPAGVNYSGIGPGRPAPPNAAFMSGVAQAASKVLGPTATVDVSSGTYSAEKAEHIERAREEAAAKPDATQASINAAGVAAGQVGSTRHTTAKAVDAGVSYTDSTGKRVNATPEQMADVAAAYAAANPEAGIGIGQGYMDDDGRSRVHFDDTGQAGAWGAGGKAKNLAEAMKETLDAVRAGYAPTPFSNPATPTARPTPTAAELAGVTTPAEVDRNYAGQGVAPSNTPAEANRNYSGQGQLSHTPAEVDRNYSGQGIAPSAAAAAAGLGLGVRPDNVGAPSVTHAFQSQDEKANTGSVANARPGFTSQDERESMATRMGMPTPAGLDPIGATGLSPTNATSKVTGAVSAQSSVGAKTVAASVQSNTGNKIGVSAAAQAALGFTNRTPAEKSAMAKAIAGEVSPSTLAGLKERDPKAMAEVAGMVATMENRAATKQFGSMAKVLGPTQYNSLMAANMATTKNNYSKYKAAVDDAVKAFYEGPVPGTPYAATNYYNPDVANPSWGPKMTETTQLGAHKFGTLPGYEGNAATQAAAAALGMMSGTDNNPGKKSDDSTGYSGTGSAYGGSAGQSAGAGYSPGGMNSPSGSAFGGSSQGGGNYGSSGNSSTGGGSGYGGGVAGGGTATGGSAGMSGGGGYTPGGMGSPSGSTAGSPSSSGNNGGLGGPTSNNSGNTGSGGGYSTGASKGSTGGL